MECLILTLALIVVMAVIDFGPVGVHALLQAFQSKKKVDFSKAQGDSWSLSLYINKKVLKNKLTEKHAHAAFIVGLPLVIGAVCMAKHHLSKGAAPL